MRNYKKRSKYGVDQTSTGKKNRTVIDRKTGKEVCFDSLLEKKYYEEVVCVGLDSGEIVDYELEDALKPFFHLYEKEKEREKRENIINKIFYLTYSSRYFVPLAHRQTYILKSR